MGGIFLFGGGGVFGFLVGLFGRQKGDQSSLRAQTGGVLNVTCPYGLGGGYLALKLKSNFAVSQHLGWLAVGMSTDISHRVLSLTLELYRLL